MMRQTCGNCNKIINKTKNRDKLTMGIYYFCNYNCYRNLMVQLLYSAK